MPDFFKMNLITNFRYYTIFLVRMDSAVCIFPKLQVTECMPFYHDLACIKPDSTDISQQVQTTSEYRRAEWNADLNTFRKALDITWWLPTSSPRLVYFCQEKLMLYLKEKCNTEVCVWCWSSRLRFTCFAMFKFIFQLNVNLYYFHYILEISCSPIKMMIKYYDINL